MNDIMSVIIAGMVLLTYFAALVMVAADLDLFPRGTIVETSLGPGIVCDTGEFIYDNPHQFDIATTW